MGYTHYFTKKRPFTDAEWEAITADTRTILEYCKEQSIGLQLEYDEPAPPQVDDSAICFNGVDEEGHETFEVRREATGFEFCKTARKPYDLPVCLVLLAIAKRAPGAMSFGSDGDWDAEWMIPQEVFAELFDGYRFQNSVLHD